jgi:hypothetical protein
MLCGVPLIRPTDRRTIAVGVLTGLLTFLTLAAGGALLRWVADLSFLTILYILLGVVVVTSPFLMWAGWQADKQEVRELHLAREAQERILALEQQVQRLSGGDWQPMARRREDDLKPPADAD